MENPPLDDLSKKYLENLSFGGIKKELDFENVSEARIESLREAIKDIEEMIEERRRLSEDFERKSEKMKAEIENFLLESAPLGEDDSEFARERAELRKKQIDISEMQLNEKVKCWGDIAMLKRELREREKELNERKNRAEMLREILGG